MNYIKLLCMFEQIETIMEYYSNTKHLVSAQYVTQYYTQFCGIIYKLRWLA